MTTATVGSLLKDARTKKGITLDEVHAKIKMHPRVLQLLEDGKFDKLPSPLFAKSFLKSYADYLGVNHDEVIDAYDHEGEAVKKEPDQVLFLKTIDEKKEETWAGQNLKKMAVLVAALVVGGLILSFAVKHVPALFSKIKISAPHWPSHKPASPESVKLQAKAAEAAAKKEAKKSDEWVRSLDQGNFPKLSKKASLELRVRALDNVWVRVTADGKVVYQGILGRNAVDTWAAKENFELWTGNAANMFLSVNRYALGSPGRGMIRKMSITREGVRIPTAENR